MAVMIAVSVGGAAAAIHAAQHSPRVAEPVLIFRGAGSPGALRTTQAQEDRALALALTSLPPAERRRLLDLVNNTTARLETKLSPLGTDLGDDESDPVAELERDTARYLPPLTAARELDRGYWQSADLRVRVADGCASRSSDEVCAPLRGSPWPSELERRARFLAWAVTASAIIELPSVEALEACAGRLRDLTTRPNSTIALVLDRGALGFEPIPERDPLRDAARRLGRAMAANAVKDDSHLESLGRTSPTGRSVPWLTLSTRELLIVPRLSAAMNRQGFAREIEHFAEPFAWVRRP